MLPLQGTWVGSLAQEIKFFMPHVAAKKKKSLHVSDEVRCLVESEWVEG